MPDGYTPVWDVGRGGGAALHGQRGDVPRAADKTDILPRLQSRAYHGVDNGTHMAYAWVRAIN